MAADIAVGIFVSWKPPFGVTLDRCSLTLFVLSVWNDLCHPPGFLEATSLMKVKNPEGEFYVKIKKQNTIRHKS